MDMHLFSPFSCNRSSVRTNVCLLAGLSFAFTLRTFPDQPKPAHSSATSETALLNQLWDEGLAAGNATDWYRNRDGNHASIPVSHYPQLGSYGPGLSSMEFSVVDAPRVIVGNASLGVNGLWGMVRSYAMSDYRMGQLHDQYRAGQHYWYPAVRDVDPDNPTGRDLTVGMSPYVSQSVGKSSSELDEVRKFFHTLAAFRPEVKTRLIDEGLLMPTLQMIFRRTRVPTDQDYLSGLAHPSAFENFPNNVAMIEMANAITPGNIPPMVDLTVLEETFGGSHSTRYNDTFRSEKLFTSPAAIARVFRTTEPSKRMVVDASTSFDVNELPLSYHFAVLRGDPDKVRINPLNGDGSKVEIIFDYQSTETDPFTGRPSNLIVVGAFVHNGAYFSAPGFITCLTLWNEDRTYSHEGPLREIAYAAAGISNGISGERAWSRDTFNHDFNQRPTGFTRFVGAAGTLHSAEGFLIQETGPHGRPSVVSEIDYFSDSGRTDWRTRYEDGDWRHQAPYQHDTFSTPEATLLRETLGPAEARVSTLSPPAHGTVTSVLIEGAGGEDGVGFQYVPKEGFVGVDTFTVSLSDSATLTARIHRIRVSVGPDDVTPPTTPEAPVAAGTLSDSVLLTWNHVSDDREVAGYRIHRDDQPIGYAYQATRFEDRGAVPGSSHSYEVLAFDDAGNESPRSAATIGTTADILGQEDLADGNYTHVDPNLYRGMSWTPVTGGISIKDGLLQPGSNTPNPALAISRQTFLPPYTFQFSNTQAYISGNQGAVVLYLDPENFYYVVINRSRSALIRRMDGEDTLIGQTSNVRMQHGSSSAQFRLSLVPLPSAITLEIEQREWTVAPDAVNRAFWADPDPAAVSRFGGAIPRPVGFIQPQTGTSNAARYGDIVLSELSTQALDLDQNDLPDAWERLYFGSVGQAMGAPDADFDSNGFSNREEFLAGTDPTNPLSVFRTDALRPDRDSLHLEWPGAHGRVYRLLMSETLDPDDWAPLDGYSLMPATPPFNAVTLPKEHFPGKAFFRVEVVSFYTLGFDPRSAISDDPLLDPWTARAHTERRIQTTLRGFGVAPPVVAPVAAPAEAHVPAHPIISNDHATYGTFVSVMIPHTAQVGDRIFRLDYGIKDVPSGTFAEHGNTYSRISISDRDAPVADPLDPVNFTKVFYLVPDLLADPGASVVGAGMMPTPDGRLLITQPVKSGTIPPNPSAYACLLQNPLDDPEDFVFGPWTYIGEGFLNHPANHGGEIRQTLSRARGNATFDPAVHDMRYGYWKFHGDTPEFVQLSVIPPVTGSDNGTQEVSSAPIGLSGIAASIRTNDGTYYAINDKAGAEGHWTTPVKIPWTSTAISKAHLIRSPSGNLIWLYNKGPATFNRRDMTVALFTNENIAQPPAVEYTFDTRGGSATTGTAVSYPHVLFLENPDGSYSGKFTVAYDYGRGAPASANETYITVFDEQGLLDGDLTFTQYTFGPDG